MKSGQCPKCGSQRIMAHLPVPDHYEYGVVKDATMRVSARPNALFFKGTEHAKLEAYVCADCGFVEQYVTHTKELWEAWQKATR